MEGGKVVTLAGGSLSKVQTLPNIGYTMGARLFLLTKWNEILEYFQTRRCIRGGYGCAPTPELFDFPGALVRRSRRLKFTHRVDGVSVWG